jgi:hypothetical protein
VPFPRNPEQAAVSAAPRGVRVSIVRLPPFVHSDGERYGFGTSLIAIVRERRLGLHRRRS